jgi:hypothetical protein
MRVKAVKTNALLRLIYLSEMLKKALFSAEDMRCKALGSPQSKVTKTILKLYLTI